MGLYGLCWEIRILVKNLKAGLNTHHHHPQKRNHISLKFLALSTAIIAIWLTQDIAIYKTMQLLATTEKDLAAAGRPSMKAFQQAALGNNLHATKISARNIQSNRQQSNKNDRRDYVLTTTAFTSKQKGRNIPAFFIYSNSSGFRLHHAFGSVTPFWPWYLPPRSL